MDSNFYDAFTGQDYEKTLFDVIFYVQGKELYAHQQILAFASTVFKKHFIKNRSTPNLSIQIDDFTYDEFYEFLRLIYCFSDFEFREPDEDKLFAILKLVDIYKVNEIKEKVGEELIDYGAFGAYDAIDEMEDNDVKDMFARIEFGYKHDLNAFKKVEWIKDFLNEYFYDLLEYDGFVNLDKTMLGAFIAYVERECNKKQKKRLYEAVIKWTKHQAMVTVEMPEEEKNQLILHYLKDILPYFSLKFLQRFFVKKHLISIHEAKKYKTIKITIKSNNHSISGSFIDDYGVYEYINSHKNDNLSDDESLIDGTNVCRLWNKQFKIPAAPSTVQKTKDARWYLLFDEEGYLYIKTFCSFEDTDYLLAEMKSNMIETLSSHFRIKTLYASYDFDIYATVSREK